MADHEFDNADEWNEHLTVPVKQPIPPPKPGVRAQNEARRQAYADAVNHRDQAIHHGLDLPSFKTQKQDQQDSPLVQPQQLPPAQQPIYSGTKGREPGPSQGVIPPAVLVANAAAAAAVRQAPPGLRSRPQNAVQLAGTRHTMPGRFDEDRYRGNRNRGTNSRQRYDDQAPLPRKFETTYGFDPFEDRDNEGDTRVRRGDPPDAHYMLPPNMAKDNRVFFNQFFGHNAKNVVRFGYDYGTHIAYDEPSSVLAIWGLPEAVEQTKNQITQFLKRTDYDVQKQQKKVHDWASVKAAPTARKRAWEVEKVKADYIRKAFRAPAEGDFLAMGVFFWPNRELKPDSLLGANYEAFDDVRYDCQCFIQYSTRRSAFIVKGNDPEKVDEAVDRMYTTYCEIATKNRKPCKMHLAIPPRVENLKAEIALNKNHALKGKQLSIKRIDKRLPDGGYNDGVQPQPVGHVTAEQKREWPAIREQLLYANEKYLRRVLSQVLSDLFYYRGTCKMRVYFGTLILFAYKRAKGNRHKLDEFMKMMRESQTNGETIRFIGDADVGKELIAHCDRLTDTFFHMNVERANASVIAEPQYSATFEVVLQRGAMPPLVCKLEVEFAREPGTEKYRHGTARWFAITPELQDMENFRRRKAPMEIQFLNLDYDMACQFEVTTQVLLGDASTWPIFPEFVKNIRLPLIPDTASKRIVAGEPNPPIHRISYVQLPGMIIESVTQKQKHSYWVANSHYVFEITKYEYLPTQTVNAVYTDGMEVRFEGVEADTRYGAALYDKRWDETLANQQHLGRGQTGEWNPEIDSFFTPSAGFGSNCGRPVEKTVIRKNRVTGEIYSETVEKPEDGVSELLGRMEACVSMIREIKDRVAKRNADPNRLPEDDDSSDSGGGEFEVPGEEIESDHGSEAVTEKAVTDSGMVRHKPQFSAAGGSLYESHDELISTADETDTETEKIAGRRQKQQDLAEARRGKQKQFVPRVANENRKPVLQGRKGYKQTVVAEESDDQDYYSAPSRG